MEMCGSGWRFVLLAAQLHGLLSLWVYPSSCGSPERGLTRAAHRLVHRHRVCGRWCSSSAVYTAAAVHGWAATRPPQSCWARQGCAHRYTLRAVSVTTAQIWSEQAACAAQELSRSVSAQMFHFCDNLCLQQHNTGYIYSSNVCVISTELMAHNICWPVLYQAWDLINLWQVPLK